MRPEPLPVSSPFGPRVHPTTGKHSFHDGIDLMLPVGAPVFAAAAGRVSRVRVDHPVSGNAITMSIGGGWAIFYAHLSKTFVEVGEHVEKGELIGMVGATGRVTGPHLHLAIYDPDGDAVDPATVFPAGTFYPA